jgi:hypothetical protein
VVYTLFIGSETQLKGNHIMFISIQGVQVVPYKAYVRAYPLQIRARETIVGGFHLTMSITDSPSDGMYQTVDHPAVFETEQEAWKFQKLVNRNRDKIKLSNWIVGNHPCDAWQSKPEDNPLYFGVHRPAPAY